MNDNDNMQQQREERVQWPEIATTLIASMGIGFTMFKPKNTAGDALSYMAGCISTAFLLRRFMDTPRSQLMIMSIYTIGFSMRATAGLLNFAYDRANAQASPDL
jgi:hypothetical protein